jgi:hypothetical protein
MKVCRRASVQSCKRVSVYVCRRVGVQGLLSFNACTLIRLHSYTHKLALLHA